MNSGERLRQLRTLVDDLSARELSQLAGVSDGLVALIESGVREIGGRSAVGLSRVLGVSLDWLLVGSGEAPPEDAVREAVAAAREQRAARGAA